MKSLEKQINQEIAKQVGKSIKGYMKNPSSMVQGDIHSPSHRFHEMVQERSFPSNHGNISSPFVSIPKVDYRSRERAIEHGSRFQSRKFNDFARKACMNNFPVFVTDERQEENWNVSENTTMILVKDKRIIASVEKVEEGYKFMEQIFSLECNAIISAHEYIRSKKLDAGHYKMIYFPTGEEVEYE